MPKSKDATPFPPVSYADWRAGVEADAGGDAVSRRLRAITEDGVPIEALYAPGGPGDGTARQMAEMLVGLLPPSTGGFRIRQQFPTGCSADLLRAALAGGIQSLEFLDEDNDPQFERLMRTLEGVSTGGPLPVLEVSWEDCRPREGVSIEFKVPMTSFGRDPIGYWLRLGGTAAQVRSELAGEQYTQPRFDTKGSHAFRATGECFNDAGATSGIALGATMSVALTYLRAMVDGGHRYLQLLEKSLATHPGPRERIAATEELVRRGVNSSWIASLIEVRLPCSQRFFESAAMLRAARLIWARILELSGIPHTPLCLVASTGRRIFTRHDPWNNSLRNTAVAFAAAIGGADVLQIAPHDGRTTEPGDAALRLARNTGLILREEAFLGKVADPAEGSWFLESLTAELAEAGWNELRQIEAEGGIIASLESGALGRRIAEAADARHDRVRDRQHPILGVSDHPVAGEVAPRAAWEDAEASAVLPFRPDALPLEKRLDAEAAR